MHRNLTRSALVAAVAALVFTGCLQEPGIKNAQAAPAAAAPSSAAVPPGRIGLPDFASLVEQVGPSVVNISVSSTVRGGNELSMDDPFLDFIRRFQGVPQNPNPRGNRERIHRGVGSGFILSQDGYVLTNHHVVDGADEVTVRLTDKREFKAKVVGSDERTDVALLKIDAKGLPSVRIGDPEKARVGEWVLAVGSPLGLDNTVTAGIISAKARRLPDEAFVPFIQTDVAINPGNSGGPLFNLNGEVIAINSRLINNSGQASYAGISLAIPIDVAMKVKAQLEAHGKVERGLLGLTFQALDKELAGNLGLDKAEGAAITSINRASAAEKAGLKVGDVILQVDGKKIDDSNDLRSLIGERRPGESVSLKVWRKKSVIDLKATLMAAPGSSASAKGNGKNGADESGAQPEKLGLRLRALQGNEARKLDVDGGLYIESASASAARAGLRTGDIILMVNNQSVGSLEEFQSLLKSGGERLLLLVQRGEARSFVALPLK